MQSTDGEVDLVGANKVAVYAHYDRYGQVHRYVLTQLQALKEAGFCVVFVTNCKALEPASILSLKPLVGKIICRKNIGYDFGAYKDGILALEKVDALDSLLIVNDSVYGPFSSIDSLLSEKVTANDDVIAITDSWEVSYHLQSYFVLFSKKVIADPDFWKFWTEMRYINYKSAVVQRYEIGLTKLLLRLRFKCSALFPYEVASKLMYSELSNADVESGTAKTLPRHQRDYFDTVTQSLSKGVPLNGTHFLWEKLLVDMGCPFVKRELLSVNPMKIPDLIRFEDKLTKVSKYDFDLIRDHLKLVSRMRSL